MSTESDKITDEDLAGTIQDDGILSSTEKEVDGLLEVGVTSLEEEEKFSMDDFDSPLEASQEGKSDTATPLSVDDLSPSDQSFDQQTEDFENVPDDASEEQVGEVAAFRKTLSELSRQLEIDRLTYLYNNLKQNGKDVPPLDKIASDIRGDRHLYPVGDQDIYAKRPFARLQGWIVGLSFGIGRRAKKFPK